MKRKYYPGCTLKSKAKNLESAAVASMKALGVDMEEIERWNCCGAVYSLAEDDLIHKVAPVRNLIRVKEQGGDRVVTLCSMCYNTLARANRLMQTDEEKRDTINRFMDEEIDYTGDVEVIHFLNFLCDEIGWDTIRGKVTRPLTGLKVAPYYGCTLQRPAEVGIEAAGSFTLMSDFIAALGATPVPFNAAAFCCGSYQVLGNPEAAGDAAAVIVNAADRAGADLLAASCPLCEYNLGKRQDGLKQQGKIEEKVPTIYFTQLLALALGLSAEDGRLDLNDPAVAALLSEKSMIAA
jgi:heterodisulfide reductase subunit B